MALHTIVEHDSTHIKPYIDAVKETLSDEVSTRANNGTSNVWRISPVAEAQGLGGVTLTKNADGSVTLSAGTTDTSEFLYPGSTTNINDYALMANDLKPNTEYIVSGAEEGASIGMAIQIYYKATSSSSWQGTGTPVGNKVKFTTASSFYCYWIRFRMTENKTISSPITLRPMITRIDDGNTNYVPYAMTNRELTDAKIDASQIAPIENGTTASTSYAQGAYFIHNGKFCKAKTSISSGATFTKGTNYEETTVAAELIALA